MRCDEIQEGFIDLLYDETSAPQASSELREHLRICPNCRKELDELKKTRKYLQLWRDESPLHGVSIPRRETFRARSFGWTWRYAGIAAMALITLLALANTQMSWNKEGFSFSTGFTRARELEKNYYTKAEFRNIMKQALDDSEFRTNETSYLMMQKMLDTVEQDRLMDLRFMRGKIAANHRN
jgi:hypothetical protein